MSNTEQFLLALKKSAPRVVMDAEDAAVFVADESGHPYDWQLILDNRGVYRRRAAEAERRLPLDGKLQDRFLEARKSLDRRHGI